MTDAAPCVVYGSHQCVTCSCSGGSEASPGSPCEGGSGGDVCSSGRDARALESDVLQVTARAARVSSAPLTHRRFRGRAFLPAL